MEEFSDKKLPPVGPDVPFKPFHPSLSHPSHPLPSSNISATFAYIEDKEYVRHIAETIAERDTPADVYNFIYKIIIDAEPKPLDIDI